MFFPFTLCSCLSCEIINIFFGTFTDAISRSSTKLFVCLFMMFIKFFCLSFFCIWEYLYHIGKHVKLICEKICKGQGSENIKITNFYIKYEIFKYFQRWLSIFIKFCRLGDFQHSRINFLRKADFHQFVDYRVFSSDHRMNFEPCYDSHLQK